MFGNEFGYGIGENSYQAAGGLAGLTKLVDEFYTNMDQLPEAAVIRSMHPKDLSNSRTKLTYFLSGWLGGPGLFGEHFGPISIPLFHKNLKIDFEERDAWIYCMERAIANQPYETSFKEYLITQLKVPAERIRQVARTKDVSNSKLSR